jgi:hypothetical protein
MARSGIFARRKRRGGLHPAVETAAMVEAMHAPRSGRRRNLAARWLASPRSKKDAYALGLQTMKATGYPVQDTPPMDPRLINAPAFGVVADRLSIRPRKKLPSIARTLRPVSKKRRALYFGGLSAPKE